MKVLTTAVLIAAVLSVSSYAKRYDTKGMATFRKKCQNCHTGPYITAATHTRAEWRDYFANDAKKLIAAHNGVKEADETFESSYYKNRRDNLKKFFVQTASDSGVVPTCDGNWCGY